jgi:hypothetical protein
MCIGIQKKKRVKSLTRHIPLGQVGITLGLLLFSAAVIFKFLRGNVMLHLFLVTELVSRSLLVPLGLFLLGKSLELGR